MVTSATLPSAAWANRSLKLTAVSCTVPIFLPTKVHRQMTPVIRKTQITSCLTVEFNRVSSISGLKRPVSAALRCGHRPGRQTLARRYLLLVRRFHERYGSRSSAGVALPARLRRASDREILLCAGRNDAEKRKQTSGNPPQDCPNLATSWRARCFTQSFRGVLEASRYFVAFWTLRATSWGSG